jgi:DnaJ-class molecular chaperone
MKTFRSSLPHILVYALLLGRFPLLALGGHSGSFDADPYQVLHVSPGCSDDEIRRSYRSQCLLTHPDKTLHLSDAERKRREEAFKRIQRAYEAIGDPQKRQQFDAERQMRQRQREHFPSGFSFPGSGDSGDHRSKFQFDGSRPHPFAGAPPPMFRFSMNDFVNSGFYQQPARRQQQRRPPFLSPWGSMMGFGQSEQSKLQSVYVQNVQVPLEDLYAGTVLDVPFRPGFLQRVVAAFRGGIGPLVLYQSLLFALPLLHFSRIAAAGCALFAFHHLLRDANNNAEPDRTTTNYFDDNEAKAYSIRILPGYKGGTKITYDEGHAQVVFVLREMEHLSYWRVGNDLHTSVTITSQQARDGCTVHVPALDRTRPDVTVRIPPGLAHPRRKSDDDAGDDCAASSDSSSNTMIVVEGLGWPIRRRRPDEGGTVSEPRRHKGDLIVHVHVENPQNESRTKRRRRNRK